MTKIWLLISLLVGALFGQPADARGYIVAVGDTCPDVSLVFPDSTTVSIRELRGNVIMLQFTASWCSVCRQEMPHIEKEIWQKFRDRGLVVIGIDRDEPMETVIRFKQEMGITYPLALDPGANVFARFAQRESGVTRNVIIDQTGKIAFLTRLYDPMEFSAMKQVIETLLTVDRAE